MSWRKYGGGLGSNKYVASFLKLETKRRTMLVVMYGLDWGKAGARRSCDEEVK